MNGPLTGRSVGLQVGSWLVVRAVGFVSFFAGRGHVVSCVICVMFWAAPYGVPGDGFQAVVSDDF